MKNSFGGNWEVVPIPIPLDCVDGFHEAFRDAQKYFWEKKFAWPDLYRDLCQKV